MAPEQIVGDPPHPSMDQYAIGIIAYELLTGRLPFLDADPVQLIFKTVSAPVPPPSEFRKLSPEIDRVVLKILSKEASSRYPSVEQAGMALREVLLG